MNTLTKNRILEKGDEYCDNGTWKPVPKDNYGLQVLFTPYKECRRPSEKPQVLHPETISESRKAGLSDDSMHPRQAESDKNPVVSHSATGDILSPSEMMETLTKVISNQMLNAACTPLVSENPEAMTEFHKKLRETPETVRPTEVPQAGSVSPEPPAEIVPCKTCGSILCGGDPCVAPPDTTHIKIKFPKPKKDIPIWTGRNGTFNGYGLDAMTVNDNIMLSPIGKRGIGNCAIEFPKAVIPQLIDWLAKQFPK